MIRIALVSLIASTAMAESPVTLELPRGAVGAVFARGVKGDATELTIIFPASVVENPGGGWIERGETATKGPVAVKGELVLFDDTGIVHRFFSGPFQLRFWCHNDGGEQTRPELKLSLVLPRPLTPRDGLGGAAGFVVVARSGTTPSLPTVSGKTLTLGGDLDGDGRYEAGLLRSQSVDCSGPDRRTQLSLVTKKGADSLRCCGP